VLEELRKFLMKFHYSTHVIILPRLLTTEWRKQRLKAADIVILLPAGCDTWPLNMHEPLTIGFVFPFLPFSPWQLAGTPNMFRLGRQLPNVFEDKNVVTGGLLRKLCMECWLFSAMPEYVVLLFFK
jgi:hypothetical protein